MAAVGSMTDSMDCPDDHGDEGGLVPECRVPILSSGQPSPGTSAPAGTSGHMVSGWTPLLILASLVTLLGCALPVGFNIGVINTPAPIIKEFCNASVAAHYGVEVTDTQLDVLWSTIVSVFLVGGMTGSMSGGWAADRFGRKGATAISMFVFLVSAVLFLACRYAGSVELLLLGRLLVGFASGLTTGVLPMYLTELAPAHLRGVLGALCPMGICVGLLVAQFFGLDWLLGTEASWHLLLAMFGPQVLVAGLLMGVMPESPKYLYLVRGEESRGLQELSRIRRQPEELLADEVRALRMAHKAEVGDHNPGQRVQEWTMWKVLTSPELRLPLVLVCALQAGQQVSGINAVFYYSGSVFETAGLSTTEAQYANLGAGFVNFGVSVLAVYLVNNFGRRRLALLSTSIACVFLVLLGTSIICIESFTWMPYVAVLSLLSYVFFYGLGMGPIPYFIGSELFDVGPRPVGMAIGSLSNWGGNFAVGMSFTMLNSAIGASSFYVFAAFTAALGIFLKLYFPETKGRDPAEVADMLRLGFKSDVAKEAPQSNSSSSANSANESP